MAYIKKEPIIEFITKGLNNPDKTKAYGYDAIEILTEIEYAPEADVVELPCRCEKCKYRKTHTCAITGTKTLFCDYGEKPVVVKPTHYCGYGEKRGSV